MGRQHRPILQVPRPVIDRYWDSRSGRDTLAVFPRRSRVGSVGGHRHACTMTRPQLVDRPRRCCLKKHDPLHQLYKQQEGRCYLCRRKAILMCAEGSLKLGVSTRGATVEHVVPRGPEVRMACKSCNSRKSTRGAEWAEFPVLRLHFRRPSASELKGRQLQQLLPREPLPLSHDSQRLLAFFLAQGKSFSRCLHNVWSGGDMNVEGFVRAVAELRTCGQLILDSDSARLVQDAEMMGGPT